MLALVLPVALAVAALAEDSGFGGAAVVPSRADDGDEVCVVKGDDGVWRPCAEIVAAKKQPDAPARDESPEAQALRARMRDVEAAAEKPAAVVERTQLEMDIEKGHLDPKTPLLALRIEVARAQKAIVALEKAGVGGAEKDRALATLADAQGMLDDVERIAVHRMDMCVQRQGKKPLVRNYRMTAGGPVLLTVNEMLAQLPVVDPDGCERILLVDEKLVARVRRAHELRRILETRSFGYYEVAERRALEKELHDVEAELARDATQTMSLPGVKDPYGR